MITLKTTKNTKLKETTVTAFDAAGHPICSETWSGLTTSTQVKLSKEVRANAEKLLSKEKQHPAFSILHTAASVRATAR